MLDETITFEKKEAKEYPLLPKGIYQAELLDIEAIQNETYDSKMGKTAEKEYQTDIKYQFTLLNGKHGDTNLRGRNVWNNYGHSFLYEGKNGKNDLFRIVEAFMKKQLNQEEIANGIPASLLNSFIGKQIMLSIETKKTKNGKEFDNIIDYLAVQTDLPSLTEEEKEKAKVKKEEEMQEPDFTPPPSSDEYNQTNPAQEYSPFQPGA